MTFRSIKKSLKSLRNDTRDSILKYRFEHITSPLLALLKDHQDEIPVFVISYNNGKYVKNIIDQLNRYKLKPIIFDNNSNCNKTITILKNLETESKASVLYSKYNLGHMIGFIQPIYDALPEKFAYTDPDLQFNMKLPDNFLDILLDLTTEYSTYKAGFALSLNHHGALKNLNINCQHTKPIKYKQTLTIQEFEKRYWKFRLKNDDLELYAAPIDTTFAVYRKDNYTGDFFHAVRVAGSFSAIHLPWFEDLDLFTDEERASYLKQNKSSSWTK